MNIKHRYDSETRRHYPFEKKYSLRLNPHLLYAGVLDKTNDWCEETHCHSFCEIMLVVSGKGQVCIDGNVTEVCCGDLIVYDPYVKHYEKTDNSEPMELLFFAADGFKINTIPPSHLLPDGFSPVIHTNERFRQFKILFGEILEECRHKTAFYGEIAASLAKAALLLILRTIDSDEAEISKTNNTALAAVNYINQNYLSEITLEDVAKNSFTDKYYLSHIFTKTYGISVGKYIKRLRIEKAKQLLLTTDASISKIALSACCGDPSYFSKVFKVETGKTPLQFRKAAK